MLLWIARGVIIGAVIGCVFLATAAGLLGALVGSMASLPSLGNPELVRKTTVIYMSYGAVYGTAAGAIIGCILGAFGNVRALFIGASVGAVSFGLGGATFGSITVNNTPVPWSRVIMVSLIGVGIGSVAGLIIGLVITPFDRYIIKRLQRTA